MSIARRLAAPVAIATVAAAAAVPTPGVAAASAAATGRNYVSLVNPWVESDISRYFFFQSASNPFGFVKLRPDTSTASQWSGGYHPREDQVKGFSHVHDWQLSGIQAMPTSGDPVPKLQGDTGWQSHVEHDDSEIAEPGYHKLHLDRYGITAELTATDRVGLHRYTYDDAGPSEIIVNLGGPLGEAFMERAHVTKVSDSEITGYVVQHGNDPIIRSQAQSRLYFDIRFDQAFDSLHGWANGSLVDGGAAVDEVAGDDSGVYVRYDHLDAGEQVQMKVGLSLTGVDGARRNLETELPGWDFDAVKAVSQQRWNDLLGRIDVQGGTPQQQEKFYTDLFHVLCGRSAISDADGKYLDNTWGHNKVKQIPLDKNGEPKFAMYNYDALWLTQWNLNTMLGLAYPEIYASLVKSQLQMYKDGGLLPRGPVAGNYSLIMTSSPVTSFISGAYNKGIRDFDVDLAYDAMLDAHSVGGLFDKAGWEYPTWGGAGGIRQYLDLDYVPHDVTGPGGLPDGAGQTLEYAFQDWTLAQLARELDKRGLNVAQLSDVTVSSQANDSNLAGVRAVDGRPIRSSIDPNQNVEWHSAGEREPWIKLAWDQPRRIRKVVISDRADPTANADQGVLTFSDGTTVRVRGIPDGGGDRVVPVTLKDKATWVKFQVTSGSGSDVGLNEFEVWDDTDMYSYLTDRSRNWRNLYDQETGFIRPKGSDGTWLEPFNPMSQTDFVEANSWQSTWFTVHDVMGLANLMGGRQAYADRLNHAFEQAERDNFIASYGQGYVSYGNQPGLEMAHLFNYVGHPWLTQHWVRQVKEKVYGATSTTDGYGHHDEDQGQMGSMSALMAMGLFEVTGAGLSRPVYDITSPIFDEVTIDLNEEYYSGDEFRIVTHDNSAANAYIQSAELDGNALNNAWFYHDQLTDGGTLELWMGPEPNKDWGVDQLPPSESEEQEPVYATDIAISGPERVEEPYSSVRFTADFMPEDTSYQRASWSVTEPDGSPTDKATIDRDGVLTVNDESGTVLVVADAADQHGARDEQLVAIDINPELLRGNAARWPGVKATASSHYIPGYAPAKVHDDRIGQPDAGDWASAGEQNPWIQLDWDQPVQADEIVLYDRAGPDDANGGVLRFDDGSTVLVSGVPPNGEAKTVTFPMKTFRQVRFEVTEGTGPNVGLGELQVLAKPSAPDAPTVVSAAVDGDAATVSWQPPAFDGGAPITGYVVTAYRDGQAHATTTVDEDTREAVVTGLDPNVAYEFKVAATTLAGTGPESPRATTGPTYFIEAESLLPPQDASAPAVRQGNCCGVTWSDNAQIWFQNGGGGPGDYLTLAVDVPSTGTYRLEVGYTRSGDFATHQLSIDGQSVGDPFPAYAPQVEVAEAPYGDLQLEAGQRSFTFTVTDKDRYSIGYSLGVDYLRLRAVD